jgi:hypothetical protein
VSQLLLIDAAPPVPFNLFAIMDPAPGGYPNWRQSAHTGLSDAERDAKLQAGITSVLGRDHWTGEEACALLTRHEHAEGVEYRVGGCAILRVARRRRARTFRTSSGSLALGPASR